MASVNATTVDDAVPASEAGDDLTATSPAGLPLAPRPRQASQAEAPAASSSGVPPAGLEQVMILLTQLISQMPENIAAAVKVDKPYSHVDSTIGFWIVNMITERRYLACCMRKKMLCRCGCRGWCSLFEVFTFLRWCFESLAKKVFPVGRHDGYDTE